MRYIINAPYWTVSLQERVTDHLREYINDLQDEIKWDNSFAKSQSKLVAAARIAKQEIAEGKDALYFVNAPYAYKISNRTPKN